MKTVTLTNEEVAEAIILKVQTNPDKYHKHQDFADEIGVSRGRIGKAMLLARQEVRQRFPGHTIVRYPSYKIADGLDDPRERRLKLGQLKRVRTLGTETAEDLMLTRNPVEMKLAGAHLQDITFARSFGAVQETVDDVIAEQEKVLQLEKLRADVARQEALVESFS